MQGGRVVLILDTLKPGEIIRPFRHAEQIEKMTDIYFLVFFLEFLFRIFTSHYDSNSYLVYLVET